MRQLSLMDNVLCEIDNAVRTIFIPKQRRSSRPFPDHDLPDSTLNAREKTHIAGLMRVNHTGEVCAQALYQGQALTAKLAAVKEQMTQAAAEEVEHLAWCENRLAELNSHPSRLNFLWYSGSLMLGALAGLAGDSLSLGFIAETERQVTAHLEKHRQQIPKKDKKTQAILTQMQEDERQHAEMAVRAGAKELPFVIKYSMKWMSKLMTKSSYYL